MVTAQHYLRGQENENKSFPPNRIWFLLDTVTHFENLMRCQNIGDIDHPRQEKDIYVYYGEHTAYVNYVFSVIVCNQFFVGCFHGTCINQCY